MFGFTIIKKSRLDWLWYWHGQMDKDLERHRSDVQRVRDERNTAIDKAAELQGQRDDAQERYGRLVETIEAVRRAESPDGPTGDVRNLANALTIARRDLEQAQTLMAESREAHDDTMSELRTVHSTLVERDSRVRELEGELAKAKQPSPEMVEAMQRMGKEFAKQVGIDPELLAYGVAVGPGGPVAVRLDEDERDRESNEADHAEDVARELGYSGPESGIDWSRHG